MPKDTFYRLSDEKRERILYAANKEFCRNSYSMASINQIIKEAEIPRGSFYQYFEDKKDLFIYVIGVYVTKLVDGLTLKLFQLNGDIFQCIETYLVAFIDDSNQSVRDMKKIFSDPWVFEMLWNEATASCSEKKNEISGKLIDSINLELLDVENEEELQILLGIVGAVIRDVLDNIFLRGENADKEKLREVFHKRIRLLKKHYMK